MKASTQLISPPRAFRGKYEALEELEVGKVCYFPASEYWKVNSARLRAEAKHGRKFRLRRTPKKVAIYRAA